MRLLPILLALPVWGAGDADAIIRRVIEAQHRNQEHANQYTYSMQEDHFEYRKDGSARPTASETYEVIFVEGLEYRKLVARNGKPLSRREQAQVDKTMAETAAERRTNSRPKPPGGVMSIHSLFGSHTVDLGSMSELLALYDNRVTGEETVRGHKTWVLDCVPRKDRAPANEHEKQVLLFAKKFWVDQAEDAVVHSLYTVTGNGGFAKPGSTISLEFEKLDPQTWQTISFVLDVSTVKQKVFRPNARTEYHMSNFHKFDVNSTITVQP
jgi:hypothetical protein